MSARWLSGGLCAALITLIALVTVYAATPPTSRSVGDQDALIFHSFHGVETAGDFTYRWSTGDGSAPDFPTSSITLPQVGRADATILKLDLWMPAEQPPTPLTLTAAQNPITTATVHGRRQLSLLLPRAATSGGDIAVALRSPTWNPPGDPRPLGIGVQGVGWTPLGVVLPPLRQIWALPGLALGVALLLARIGRGVWLSGVVGAGVGVVLAIAAALRPLEWAPFTHRLLWIVLLTHAALLLWSLLLRSHRRDWRRLPQPVDPAALLVLLGVGYWMLLIYQRALCAETVTGVCPRPGTQIIGAIVLVALFALLPFTHHTRLRSVLIVLALGGVAEAIYAATFAFRRSGPDFFILWRAAYDFSLGRPLYRVADVLANHYGHVFKVPPFYGMLFLPIANATDAQYNLALAAHRGMNIVLYLVTGGLLARLLRPYTGTKIAFCAVAIVMGLMQPPFDTIAYGQIDIVLLLLLTIGLLGLRNRVHWLVGLAIALGTLFKLYPLMIVGLLLARREWRAIGWTAAWFAILNALAIGVMGWQNHVIYVTQVVPNIGGGTSWVENQTINGFLSRLLTGTMQTDPIHDRALDLLTYGSFAFVAGLSLLLALRPSNRTAPIVALQWSIFAVVMVLAVPAAWMHYSTITILTFIALIWFAADRPLSPARALLIAFAFGLIAYGNQWSFFDGTRNPGLPALALSYKFYGLAMLWTITAQAIWQAARAERRRSSVQSAPVAASASSLG